MYNFSKDGIVVSTVLDARTANKEGKYPIKIKVYYQRKPKYYSIGICMTKEEWNKLPDSKSSESKKIRQAIESSFSLVRMNVEALAEKGTFSFNTLNLRLGKATGDTLNSAIRAKIEELKNEERIGTMQFYQTTLVMVEEVGGNAKKIKVAEDVDFNKIARMASGASGAELANIVNEAALRAVRDGRRFATQADLEESIEVVIAGYQKKNAIMTDEEKKIVSYHEIGHALVAAMQTHSAPVQKITIVPRTSGALGYTMQVEEGNHYLMSKTEMENKIATLTGGRAAEEVVFHSVTTGASNDIEQATKLARAMITRYGMSDDFDMVALETVNNQYLGGDASLACSAETQTKIDQRVVELVKAQHEKAVNILTENRAKLDELAQYLYEKETITGEEFMNIVNAK